MTEADRSAEVFTEAGSIARRGTVLVLAGDVDTALVLRFQRAVTDVRGIDVVDAREVAFLGSRGLSLLAQVAAGAERRVRLVGSRRSVLRPLQVTGLDALLDIQPGLD